MTIGQLELPLFDSTPADHCGSGVQHPEHVWSDGFGSWLCPGCPDSRTEVRAAFCDDHKRVHEQHQYLSSGTRYWCPGAGDLRCRIPGLHDPHGWGKDRQWHWCGGGDD